MFLVCMLLTACQQGNIHENPIGPPEENGSTGEGGTVDTSGMVWFPKSAKGTSEDGLLHWQKMKGMTFYATIARKTILNMTAKDTYYTKEMFNSLIK